MPKISSQDEESFFGEIFTCESETYSDDIPMLSDAIWSHQSMEILKNPWR